MATWMVHLRVAEKIKDALPFIDETPYYVGSIAPDSGRMVDDFSYFPPKDVSHWKREGVSYEQRFKDNAEFFEKFIKNESDNYKKSLFIGYYVHILTDTIFVREIINPFIERHGKPFWRSNISKIRRGWYEIDYRFLEKHSDFRPLKVIDIKDFPNTYFDYFTYDDITERINNAVWIYSHFQTDMGVEMVTHNESDCERIISQMTDEITKILENHGIINR